MDVFALTAAGAVRCEPVLGNKPARVMVMLPASVEAGKLTVEVRIKIIGLMGKLFKTIEARLVRQDPQSKTSVVLP